MHEPIWWVLMCDAVFLWLLEWISTKSASLVEPYTSLLLPSPAPSLPPPTRLHQYADPVTDLLDQCGVFRTRLFRESCVFHQGCYVKDLSRLGRDLHKTLILDNSPASYIFHPNNAVSFDLLLIFVIKNIDTNIQKKAWVLGGKWQKVNLFFIKAWILFSPKIWKGFSPDLYPDEEEVWWCEISSNKIINQTKFK